MSLITFSSLIGFERLHSRNYFPWRLYLENFFDEKIYSNSIRKRYRSLEWNLKFNTIFLDIFLNFVIDRSKVICIHNKSVIDGRINIAIVIWFGSIEFSDLKYHYSKDTLVSYYNENKIRNKW